MVGIFAENTDIQHFMQALSRFSRLSAKKRFNKEKKLRATDGLV
jgi:hypothetical protein